MSLQQEIQKLKTEVKYIKRVLIIYSFMLGAMIAELVSLLTAK